MSRHIGSLHCASAIGPCCGRVRIRHAGATRPMLTGCDKSQKRSTVRLFRDAGSSDAASGFEPIADARGARETHAETASGRGTLVELACQRGVTAGAGVPVAGAPDSFTPRSRPVRHGFAGRSTNSRVTHLNACVMSFSQLSFGASRKCFRTDPRRVRCLLVVGADDRGIRVDFENRELRSDRTARSRSRRSLPAANPSSGRSDQNRVRSGSQGSSRRFQENP